MICLHVKETIVLLLREPRITPDLLGKEFPISYTLFGPIYSKWEVKYRVIFFLLDKLHQKILVLVAFSRWTIYFYFYIFKTKNPVVSLVVDVWFHTQHS